MQTSSKRSVVMVAALLLLVTLAAAAPPECIKDQLACVRGSECCGGCCQDEKCVPHAEDCTAAQNPCTLYECPSGKSCYLHQVQCVADPCPPVPACRDEDYKDYEES